MPIQLNKEFWDEFSTKSWTRCHTTYAYNCEGHDVYGFLANIQEELGELSSAIMGVLGKKARKKHLAMADVADAVGDAISYMDLLASKLGLRTYDIVTEEEPDIYFSGEDTLQLMLKETPIYLGGISENVSEDGFYDGFKNYFAHLFLALNQIATLAGYELEPLLRDTFNFTSERDGSEIRIGQ